MEIEDKLNVLIGAYEKNKMLSMKKIYRTARLSNDTEKINLHCGYFSKDIA